MPARRKTPEAKGAAERGRPSGGSEDELRAWYEDKVRRATHARIRTGFESGSEEELVGLGVVLLELGVDPNALLLDAAVTALQERCEKKGLLSKRGRKADVHDSREQEFGDRILRVLVEMSEAAQGTHALPEPDRLEEMAVAAAGELVRSFVARHEENFGEKPNESAVAVQGAEALCVARGWLAAHPAIARELLDRGSRRDPDPVGKGAHERAVRSMLDRLDPAGLADFLSDAEKMVDVRKNVARRAKKSRIRAAAVGAALGT